MIAEGRKKLSGGFAVVAVLAIAAHAGTLANGFVFDDRGAVLENPIVHAPLDVHALFSTDYWGGRPPNWRVGIWRPLAAITFWSDQRLGGGRPSVFHFTNVLFHALASVALTFAVYRQSGRLRLAVVTGSTFAVLAVNSEAVAGIVSRADVMAAGLGFLAWASVAPFTAPLAAGQLAAFSAALLAALMCKEAAVAPAAGLIAGCAALYAAEPRQRSLVPLGQLIVTVGGVLLIYVALRQTLVAPLSTIKRDILNNPLLNEPIASRIWTGLAILTLTIERSAFPLRLIPDYSFAEITPLRTPFHPHVVFGLVFLVALIASAWWLRRREPMWTMGVVMLVVGWLALSNIPVPLPIVFAERLLYGITASMALLFAAGIDGLWLRQRQAAWTLLAVLIGGNLVRSVARDRDWHDDLRLFSRATYDAPRTARAWNNLGAALMQDGRRADALDALDRAIAIEPNWSPPHTLAGITLADLGRRREAEASLRRGYAINPDDAQAAYNLAVLLAQWGRPSEASAVLQHFLTAHPGAARERELLQTLRTR